MSTVDPDWLLRWLCLTPAEAALLRLGGYGSDDWAQENERVRMTCAAVRARPDLPPRPLWLFACAIIRQSWEVQTAARQRAVILGEAAADFCAGVTQTVADQVQSAADRDLPEENVTEHMSAEQARLRLATICCHPLVLPEAGVDRAFNIFALSEGIDESKCPEYLRDLIYNPFLPQPVFEDRWLYANHAAVLLLAQAILYDYRYDRLPELAAALEKAGCTDDRILSHCRRKEPHVRGCWVVDGLLRPDRDPLQRLLRHPPVPGDRLAEYLLSDPKDVFTLYRG